MTDATPPPSETQRFIGRVVMIIGILWLATTGLCTLAVVWIIAAAYAFTPGDFQTIAVVAIPSALVGWAIYALGRWLRPKA